MPSFGAEYNTILANIATLYDLRERKIEVVKINKRIDQVSAVIRHPLVQDSTGIIHSFNTNTGNYVPVSVLPLAELPNVAHYQNGAMVSVDGILYLNNAGEWIEVESTTDETLTLTINSANYTDPHVLEFTSPVKAGELEVILFHTNIDARNALETATSTDQQNARYKKYIVNNTSSSASMSDTDRVLAILDPVASGMLETLITYLTVKMLPTGEVQLDIDWSAASNTFHASEGANCSVKIIAKLKVWA